MKQYLMPALVLLLYCSSTFSQGIYKKSATADYGATYIKIHTNLEDSRFFVIEEINIGKSLASLAKKWGEDYNRNKLDNIRVMVICNGWYANRVSNLDTDMLALCPLRVTLTQKGGVTTALFARPSTFAKDSPALPVLKEAEDTIIQAIDKSFPPSPLSN